MIFNVRVTEHVQTTNSTIMQHMRRVLKFETSRYARFKDSLTMKENSKGITDIPHLFHLEAWLIANNSL